MPDEYFAALASRERPQVPELGAHLAQRSRSAFPRELYFVLWINGLIANRCRHSVLPFCCYTNTANVFFSPSMSNR